MQAVDAPARELGAHIEMRQSYYENKGVESFNLRGEWCVNGSRLEPQRRYCFPGLQVCSGKGRKQTRVTATAV